MANQVRGLVLRVFYDILVVGILVAFKDVFWESEFGVLIWIVLLIGFVLLPWVNWLKGLLKP